MDRFDAVYDSDYCPACGDFLGCTIGCPVCNEANAEDERRARKAEKEARKKVKRDVTDA
jgi:hypothetical protein